MKTVQNFQNKQEFEAYLMIYCSSIYGGSVSDRWNQIKHSFGYNTFNHVMRQFKKDSDITCIERIQSAVESLQLNKEELNALMFSIKHLFSQNGYFGVQQKMIFSNISRMITA